MGKNNLPQLLTKNDVARLLGVTTRLLDVYVSRGVFPPGVRLVEGGRQQWSTVTVEKWLMEKEVELASA